MFLFKSTSALRSAATIVEAAAGHHSLTKQVQIITKPCPRNIAESRLILAALQKFGEVVTFRHLRGNIDEPQGTTLAIFEAPESAARAIEASPLTVSISNDINPRKSPNEHVLAADPLAETRDSLSERPDKFTCEIQESLHDHQTAVKENVFYNRFHVYNDSFQYRDLIHSGIPHPALADGKWTSREPPNPMSRRWAQARNETLGATSLMRVYQEGLDRETEKKRTQTPSDNDGQDLAAKRNDLG